MSTALMSPDQTYKINPEALEFVQTYLSCLDLDEAANQLNITKDEASYFLNQKEVKRFIDTVFLEQGYMNRFKLSSILEDVIKSKLEEAAETGIYSGKDLIDILKFMHTMHMDHAKLMVEGPKNQTNVQVNNSFGGDNLGSLIDRIIRGE